MAQDPLQAARRYARQYWFADGLAELVIGTGFVLYAGFLAWNAYVDPRPAPWAQVLVVFALVFGTRWMVQWLKWRLTYPRTGYVRYARTARGIRLAVATLMVGALALAVWQVTRHVAWAYWLILGLGMAALYAALGLWQGWPRGLAYAALALLTVAVAVGWAARGAAARAFVDQGGPWFLLLGLAQVVAGGVTLRAYLRRHPHPLAEDEP